MLNGYKIIALCLSRIQDSSNIEFVSELNEKLSKQGYRIFIYHISTDLYWNENREDAETLVFELIDYSIVDVMIIMDEKIKAKFISEQIIANACNAKIPVIIVDGHYENCLNVQFDYRAGFEKIVRHVMNEHKPKKMHFMAGIKDNKFSDERLEVFCKVLEENGVVFDDSMVSYGEFWAEPTIEAMQQLLNNGELPDAIICANDIMAINVIAVLKNNGYCVPKDIIVTGFDGIEEVHLTNPKITTSFCSYKKLADAVVDLIDKKEGNGDYYVMPTLMISESCGCTYSTQINIIDSFSNLNSRFYRYQDDNRILAQIAESIPTCTDMEEVALKMESPVMSNLCCLLNTRCLDATKDPMLSSKNEFDEEMYLLFDALESKPFIPKDFKRKDIVPNIDILLNQKYPLIFAELDFMNVSLGYTCFYFNSCDSTNYGKVSQIVNSLNSGLGGLLNRRYQQYLAKQVEHIYVHDALTGLYNRLGFTQECEKMISRVKDNHGIITMVLADLDGLKTINDNYGHTAGDNAIQMVAKALKYGCPPVALCVRYGGDEMLAVIEGDYDKNLIRNKINEFLDEYNDNAKNPYMISTSIGILHSKITENIDFEELIKQVDELMYHDKIEKKQKG